MDPEIDSVTWIKQHGRISCKFGHQMTSLALITNLATKLRYLHQLHYWAQVLEINNRGYHGRESRTKGIWGGTKGMLLYFWRPRLTRKWKLWRLKHSFGPAKSIVLSPQIQFLVPPSNCFVLSNSKTQNTHLSLQFTRFSGGPTGLKICSGGAAIDF